MTRAVVVVVVVVEADTETHADIAVTMMGHCRQDGLAVTATVAGKEAAVAERCPGGCSSCVGMVMVLPGYEFRIRISSWLRASNGSICIWN